jgi:hypothetical protein
MAQDRMAAPRASKEHSAFDLRMSRPLRVPNVVKIDTPTESIWLARIERFEQYRGIVDWATQSKAAGKLLALPKDLQNHTLDPFR